MQHALEADVFVEPDGPGDVVACVDGELRGEEGGAGGVRKGGGAGVDGAEFAVWRGLVDGWGPLRDGGRGWGKGKV